MKQGSKVHKTLERQDHITVPVETVSAEDRFGLRIWNSIDSLRRLRETGLTRELEVWGVVEDEVVIGIIDEISTQCPDEAMEAAILEDQRRGSESKGSGSKSQQLPPDQRTLTDFLTSSQNSNVPERNSAFLGTLQEEKPRKYYLKDIKTRQSRTLPGSGPASRPTHMQLMLYHRLLSALAANEVPAYSVFRRYSLDAGAPFSDKFIAEVANLNIASYEPPADVVDDEPLLLPTLREDPLNELLAHNTLESLWSLLITECARTFHSSSYGSPSTISPLLVAEFRTASPKRGSEEEILEQAGTIIGQRCFAFDAAGIERYIRSEMAWWKGERPAVGVEVEEAFKCRICEFADGCTWRATKVDEGLKKARLRHTARAKSEV
jgi:exonuclease V